MKRRHYIAMAVFFTAVTALALLWPGPGTVSESLHGVASPPLSEADTTTSEDSANVLDERTAVALAEPDAPRQIVTASEFLAGRPDGERIAAAIRAVGKDPDALHAPMPFEEAYPKLAEQLQLDQTTLMGLVDNDLTWKESWTAEELVEKLGISLRGKDVPVELMLEVGRGPTEQLLDASLAYHTRVQEALAQELRNGGALFTPFTTRALDRTHRAGRRAVVSRSAGYGGWAAKSELFDDAYPELKPLGKAVRRAQLSRNSAVQAFIDSY